MKSKNIMKAFFSMITAMLLLVACNDKEANLEQFALKDGAMLDMSFSGAYFFGVGEYSYSVDLKIENTPVTSVTGYKQFIAADGSVSEEVKIGDFTSFPTDRTSTITELLSDVPVNGVILTEADLAPGDKWVFRFEVNMSDGRVLRGRDLSGTQSFNLNFSCPSDLAGMYSVTTTYGYHDFLPNEATYTIDAEIFQGDVEGTYSVFDFSGGLYSIGSYSSAYGTSSFEVTFSEVCGSIQWSGQSDAWGPCVPLDGGVNSVDPTTGVITISWFNEAYGENGVSVYTPK